jgi:hypothetical protein
MASSIGSTIAGTWIRAVARIFPMPARECSLVPTRPHGALFHSCGDIARCTLRSNHEQAYDNRRGARTRARQWHGARRRLANHAAPRPERTFTGLADNGTSRLDGDSYAALERARTAPAAGTPSIAEANKARAATLREKPAMTARRGKTIMSPFRDDAA